MSEEVTTTQKIQADLLKQIADTERQQAEQVTLQGQNHLRWLRSKLNFYTSRHYQEYKEQNQ